ncbi:DUF2986 domain-containing protein [Vibrio sp. S17_S38]|uniref:DUF2986 domain-containing protein n=1 Tax=Vibrio sp. S17_S38 TaxID=2720229 RepID=UPI00167FEC98|nr:DUF2986 domain-containing protein [Vibrio sp. S17_S38]MBD1573571.1 DUF2986 domain-containing protein [Vibrio sp. S17_S38]
MNRKKKINSILKKRIKKMNSKLHPSNKPKYISKAEREKLAAEAAQDTTVAEQNETAVEPQSEVEKTEK